MELSNKHGLTQLEWELQSVISIVKGLIDGTSKDPDMDKRLFTSLHVGIRDHLKDLEKDLGLFFEHSHVHWE